MRALSSANGIRKTEHLVVSGEIIAVTLRNLNFKSDGPCWTDLKSAGFDPEALWKRVEGDPELLRELIAVFETEYPGMLASAGKAIENHDSTLLERTAHKIKGTVTQFSGGAAAAAALELEQLAGSGTLTGASGAVEKLKREIQWLVGRLHLMNRSIEG